MSIPTGTTVRPAGTFAAGAGTLVQPAGQASQPAGTTVQSAGSVALPAGKTVAVPGKTTAQARAEARIPGSPVPLLGNSFQIGGLAGAGGAGGEAVPSEAPSTGRAPMVRLGKMEEGGSRPSAFARRLATRPAVNAFRGIPPSRLPG